MKINEQTIREMDQLLAQADPETRRFIEAYLAHVWALSPEERERVINIVSQLQDKAEDYEPPYLNRMDEGKAIGIIRMRVTHALWCFKGISPGDLCQKLRGIVDAFEKNDYHW